MLPVDWSAEKHIVLGSCLTREPSCLRADALKRQGPSVAHRGILCERG